MTAATLVANIAPDMLGWGLVLIAASIVAICSIVARAMWPR